jgi:hypothetical protein
MKHANTVNLSGNENEKVARGTLFTNSFYSEQNNLYLSNNSNLMDKDVPVILEAEEPDLIISEHEDEAVFIDTAPFFYKVEAVLDRLFRDEFMHTEKYQELMHKLPENLIEYEFAQQAGLL